MRKEETLRGRGSFQRLYRSGRRVEGEVLRCVFQCESGAGTLVRAGFSVSSKRFNAVKRNRARRIMRAAYRLERAKLAGAAAKSGRALNVLFIYRGTGDPMFVSSQRVCDDMSMLCRTLCAATGEHP